MRKKTKVLPPRDNHYYVSVYTHPDTFPVAILHNAAGSVPVKLKVQITFLLSGLLSIVSLTPASLWSPEKQTSNERAGLEISIRESSAKVVAEAVGSNIIYHLLTAYYVSGGVQK